MGRIYGRGDYVIEDDHLARAHQKLMMLILETTDTDCWIVPPIGQGAPARFMLDGKTDLCRRWSWRVFNGPIPEGHRVYMKCGSEHCVNPLHMYAYKRTRQKRERKIVRPKAKLNWEIVEHMRSLEDPDIAMLAFEYQVHPSTIRAILQRKTWVNQ